VDTIEQIKKDRKDGKISNEEFNDRMDAVNNVSQTLPKYYDNTENKASEHFENESSLSKSHPPVKPPKLDSDNSTSIDEREDLGYINQYLDYEKMFFGKKYNYKKTVSNSNINPNKMQWPTDAVRNFLYDTSNGGDFIQNDKYQDPTYLGFDIMMIADESALFNYDYMRPNAASPMSFMIKYNNIVEIRQRASLLDKFIKELKQYFAFSTDSDKTVLFNKRHYVQTIEGLDKLTNKIVEYEKDFIEITMNEDVSLRMQYLIDLYNNIIYDYRNKRGVIPENLLRFNMYIRIKDIRSFKVPNPFYDPDTSPQREKFLDSLGAFSGEFGGAYTLYKLYDCQFDFVKSQTHEGSITIAGFNPFNQGNMNNTKIKIKYKSVSKVFESMLINDKEIVSINNYDLSSTVKQMNGYNDILSTDNDYLTLKEIETGEKTYNVKNEANTNSNKDIVNHTGKTYLLSGKKESLDYVVDSKDNAKRNFAQKIKDRAKTAGTNFIEKKILDAEHLTNSLIRESVGAVNGKISEIRGSLITDLKRGIENQLPWDKLGNVYSTNFRQMSIQNLGRDLISRSVDIAFDESDLMELTRVNIDAPNVSFTKDNASFSGEGALPEQIKNRKEKFGDDSYLGKESDILKNTGSYKPKIKTNPNKKGN